MIRSNPDRNNALYACWEQGLTIEEAAEREGVPRSTVGYYYKKFDAYATKGKPIPIVSSTREEEGQVHRRLRDVKMRDGLFERVQTLKNQRKVTEALLLVELYEKEKKLGLDERLLDAEKKSVTEEAMKIIRRNKVEIFLNDLDLNHEWQDGTFSGMLTIELDRIPPYVFEFLRERGDFPFVYRNYSYEIRGTVLSRSSTRRRRTFLPEIEGTIEEIRYTSREP